MLDAMKHIMTIFFSFRKTAHAAQVHCRDGHETSMAETETRPRRDVCRSRDVTETLKCTFIVTNAVYYLNELTL